MGARALCSLVCAGAVVAACGGRSVDDRREVPVAAAPAPELPPIPASIDWLSHDVRRRRLTAQERVAIAGALRGGTSRDDLARQLAERWLSDEAALRLVVERWLRIRLWSVDPGHLFAEQLARVRRPDGEWTYYLPSKLPPGASAPCSEDAVQEARPWWDPGRVVRICPTSYRPERPFDDVGWCGGQLEPRLAEPARASCGCGAVLLACLPPEDEVPGIVDRLGHDMREELIQTTISFIQRDASYVDWLQATDTWQTGLVRFLYLRRDLVAQLRAQGYSTRLGDDMAARVAEIPLDAGGKLVARPAPYAGTGVMMNTPYVHAAISTYRDLQANLWSLLLCRNRDWSVNVDRDAVLSVMKTAPSSKRPIDVRFDVWNTPMRKVAGCSTCHLPMDSAAAFLGEVQVPLQGSHPRKLGLRGDFYLANHEDRRGSAATQAELAQLMSRQPELATCAVERTLRTFADVNVNEPVIRAEIAKLTAEFAADGFRIRTLMKRALASEAYAMTTGDAPVPQRTDAEQTELRSRISAATAKACVRCHDADHPVLDLSELPAASDTEAWTSILTQVESRRMPPEQHGKLRYPIAAAARADLVRAIQMYMSTPGARPRSVADDVWFAVVDRLLGGAVSEPDRLARVKRYRGLVMRTNGAVRAALIDAISQEVCTDAVASLRVQRKLPPASALDRLYDAIYDREPDDAERAALSGRSGADVDETLVGLCVGYLAGPEIWRRL